MKESNLYIITFFIIGVISLIGWILIEFTRLKLLGRCIILCAVTSPAIGFAHFLVYAHSHPDPLVALGDPGAEIPDKIPNDPIVQLFLVPLTSLSILGSSTGEAAWELNCVVASFMWAILYAMLGWIPIWLICKMIRRLIRKPA